MGLTKEQIELMSDIYPPYVDDWLKEFENMETTKIGTNSVIIDDYS